MPRGKFIDPTHLTREKRYKWCSFCHKYLNEEEAFRRVLDRRWVCKTCKSLVIGNKILN